MGRQAACTVGGMLSSHQLESSVSVNQWPIDAGCCLERLLLVLLQSVTFLMYQWLYPSITLSLCSWNDMQLATFDGMLRCCTDCFMYRNALPSHHAVMHSQLSWSSVCVSKVNPWMFADCCKAALFLSSQTLTTDAAQLKLVFSGVVEMHINLQDLLGI